MYSHKTKVSLIDGEEKFTGTIGGFGTSSFYPPHHMNMGEGGAVYTNNPKLYCIAKSFREIGVEIVFARQV